jgi:hypothetical protein
MHIELDERKTIDEGLGSKHYDLLFVDDAVYTERSRRWIEEGRIGRKVLISYSPEAVPGFDLILKKPFLPSQVLNIMENTVVSEESRMGEAESVSLQEETEEAIAMIQEETIPSIFPLATEEVEEEIVEKQEEESSLATPAILDSREIEKIKDLLEMDEIFLPTEESVPDEVVTQRKVEAITAQLIADGVEILEEEEIVETLHSGKKPKKEKKRKSSGPFTPQEFDAIQKICRQALLELKPKKVKKLLKGKPIKLKLKLKDQA